MATIPELVPGVVRFLVQVARERRLTTYGEVAQAVGTHHRVVPKVVEVVKAVCLEEGWPPLIALVLRAGSERPSLSCMGPWLGGEAPHGDEAEVVGEWLERVCAFDWGRLLERYGVE